MLGLPAMAGRLREIAAFTTDGWLQRWKGYLDFVPAKLILSSNHTWREESQGQRRWWAHRHELGGCLQAGFAQVGGRWRAEADGALSRVVGGLGGQD